MLLNLPRSAVVCFGEVLYNLFFFLDSNSSEITFKSKRNQVNKVVGDYTNQRWSEWIILSSSAVKEKPVCMRSREHLPCCCGLWGRWLASMKHVPAKLPPHYTAEQHRHCSWPRKCKDVLYLCGLKLLWISTFERLCVKHFLLVLKLNPDAELKGSGLYSAYSAIQNLYDFS